MVTTRDGVATDMVSPSWKTFGLLRDFLSRRPPLIRFTRPPPWPQWHDRSGGAKRVQEVLTTTGVCLVSPVCELAAARKLRRRFSNSRSSAAADPRAGEFPRHLVD